MFIESWYFKELRHELHPRGAVQPKGLFFGKSPMSHRTADPQGGTLLLYCLSSVQSTAGCAYFLRLSDKSGMYVQPFCLRRVKDPAAHCWINTTIILRILLLVWMWKVLEAVKHPKRSTLFCTLKHFVIQYCISHKTSINFSTYLIKSAEDLLVS